MTRIETGVHSFPDDWPGLFIRGDHCHNYYMILDNIISDLKDSKEIASLDMNILIELRDLLLQPMVEHKVK